MIKSNNSLMQSYITPEVVIIDTDIQWGIASSPESGLIDDWSEKDPITL